MQEIIHLGRNRAKKKNVGENGSDGGTTPNETSNKPSIWQTLKAGLPKNEP